MGQGCWGPLCWCCLGGMARAEVGMSQGGTRALHAESTQVGLLKLKWEQAWWYQGSVHRGHTGRTAKAKVEEVQGNPRVLCAESAMAG